MMEIHSHKVAGTSRSISAYLDGSIWNRDALLIELRCPNGTTDNELLIRGYERWGKNLPLQLDGEFAFVIEDRARKIYLAARDPLGVRPLFYRENNGKLEFSHSLQSFVSQYGGNFTVDTHTMLSLLMEVHIDTNSSLLKNIQRLPPGYSLFRQNEKTTLTPYFHWKPEPLFSPKDSESLAREHHRLLRNAIEKRINLSTKSGVLLSGGIDSSSLICTAGKIAPEKMESFSLRFEDAHASDQGIIDLINSSGKWQANSFWPYVNAPEFQLSNWNLWDVPFNPSLMMFRPLFEAAKARGVSQLWWGTGADEGLTTTTEIYSDLLRSRKIYLLLEEMKNRNEMYPNEFIKYALKPLLPSFLNRFWRKNIRAARAPAWVMPSADAQEILIQSANTYRKAEAVYPDWSRRSRYLRLFSSGTYASAFEQLAIYSSSFGVSSSLPLLDLDLLRFCFRLPLESMTTGKLGKQLLRDSLAGVVPDAARLHPKFQNYTAFAIRVMHSNQKNLEGLFKNSRLVDLGLLNPKILKRWLSWERPDDDLLPFLQAIDLEKWLLRF